MGPGDLTVLLGALVLGYLVGSIPFGVVLTRLAGLGDIRAIGSGNIGATNVLRTGRKGLAALTLLLDGLKGAAAVLLAMPLGPLAPVAAGLGAFLGHVFPAWLRFRGGKGVATYLGVLAGMHWPAAIVFAVIWLSAATVSRMSSMSALAASALTPFVLLFTGRTAAAALFFVLTAILWWRHADNIRRLIAGTETRIGGGGQ